ncbi:MAG: ABC transporter ATP-binding protein [Aquificota bacterium]|nr:MAG: ABC transporter ATP-binding protein [Aquificota bacterium]
MLKVKGIHTYYGDSHVLQGVSLEVHKGEVVCLLGRNGAGKSTTMKSIIGLVPPRQGTIIFMGEETTGLPPYKMVWRGMAYVPEDRRVFPDLTVEENLEVAQIASKREGIWSVQGILEVFPMLDRLRHRKAGNLSGGEQQLLVIARALLANPYMLLLDEPCEGLAPIIVEELEKVILEIRQEVTILLAEQNAPFALRVSHRGYVIEKGQIKFQGTREELLSNEEVQSRYLAL